MLYAGTPLIKKYIHSLKIKGWEPIFLTIGTQKKNRNLENQYSLQTELRKRTVLLIKKKNSLQTKTNQKGKKGHYTQCL